MVEGIAKGFMVAGLVLFAMAFVRYRRDVAAGSPTTRGQGPLLMNLLGFFFTVFSGTFDTGTFVTRSLFIGGSVLMVASWWHLRRMIANGVSVSRLVTGQMLLFAVFPLIGLRKVFSIEDVALLSLIHLIAVMVLVVSAIRIRRSFQNGEAL